jgi:hypothetical protein
MEEAAMSSPVSPKLLRGGLIVVDSESGVVARVITFQYNPDSLSRSFQFKAGGEGGARSEALRIAAVPSQSITAEIELDAADALAAPDANAEITEHGLASQLAAIESLVYPTAAAVLDAAASMAVGELEIVPANGPVVLFAFGRRRILPVRITELTVTEEAFDPNLRPIRAKVRLGLKVLTVGDVGTTGSAGGFAVAAHQQMERLATAARGGRLSDLGVEQLP